MIRILHTADLHLDKEFFPDEPRLSSLRKKEQQALFANIMMYARDRKVDVLLISGGLLDRLAPDEETGNLILREFENAAAEIFLSPGPDDPYRPGGFYATAAFPENVHIFDRETVSAFPVDRLGLTVYGYAFCHKKLYADPLAAMPQTDPSRINLLCASASLTGEKGRVPLTEEQIARTACDYFALGGSSAPSEPEKAGQVCYASAGSPEGLNFDENGVRGARILLLDKEDGRTTLQSKAVPFSRRRFEKITLDADGLADCYPLYETLAQAVKDLGADSDTLLQVTVRGRVPSTFRLKPEVFAKIAEKLCYLRFCDETVLLCTGNGQDFLSVFSRKVAEKTDDEELRSKILKCGFSALENAGK